MTDHRSRTRAHNLLPFHAIATSWPFYNHSLNQHISIKRLVQQMPSRKPFRQRKNSQRSHSHKVIAAKIEDNDTHHGSNSISPSSSLQSLPDSVPSRSRSGTLLKATSSSAPSRWLPFQFFESRHLLKRSPSAEATKPRLFSLYRLLLSELNLPSDTNNDYSLDLAEQTTLLELLHALTNMIRIPFHLEGFMAYGNLVCLNSFLTLFTLAPLKIIIVSTKMIWNPRKAPEYLFCVSRDCVTLFSILAAVLILSCINLDVSRMYHDIRGHAHLKLYVTYGVLEVVDKLCATLGHDLFSILHNFSISKSSRRWLEVSKFILVLMLAISYLCFHAYILIYQTVSLNVAANSYSNALLTLLLSNQFAELKGAVFKKFEREGLFQISLSDLAERFQLSLMLSIIALRNIIQLSRAEQGMTPNSWLSWNAWMGAIFGPTVIVMGSEILVDWIKHCYIAKFNKIRPRIYRKFLLVLSLDFVEVSRPSSALDSTSQHELVNYVLLTRRIGLPLLAIAVCFLRMSIGDLINARGIPITFLMEHSVQMLRSIATTGGVTVACFAVLLLMRLILGLILLKLANHIGRSVDVPNLVIATSLLPRAHDVMSTTQPDALHISTPCVNQFDMENGTLRLEAAHFFTPCVNPFIVEGGTPPPDSIEQFLEDSPIRGSPDTSSIDFSFLPGIPNVEKSAINPSTRLYLYDRGETVPPTLEEKRNSQLLGHMTNRTSCAESAQTPEGLENVMRYEMCSKRIW